MILRKEKDCLAIAIGESSISAAYLRGHAPNTHLVGLARESLEGIDPAQWHETILKILAPFGLKKTSTVCVIPSNIVTTKNIEIPSLEDDEIRSIIDLQAGRHTPYSREEILVSYVSVGVFQRNYTKVLLVIANRNVIKARLDACEAAGLIVDRVVFAPECVAAFYADVLHVDAQDDPVGIIDIGYHATDFIVEHNQTVATCRNIPVGIKDLLADGSSGKDRLVNELVQSLEIYRNEDINKMPARYVVTSASSVATDLVALLQTKLNAEVRAVSYGQDMTNKAGDPQIRRLMEEESFASVMAAAQFFHKGLQVDLMPEDVKSRRAIIEKGRQVIMSGIFLIVLVLMVCGLFFTKIYFRNFYLQRLKDEYAVKRYAVVRLDKIAHRTRIIKDFLSTRMVSLDVLNEIYRLIPTEMYLQNIFMDEAGEINIQGISESMSTVFNVVKALEDSALFKNVKTRSTTASKDRGKDVAAFDLIFKLESAPDAPIGEVTPDDAQAEPPAEEGKT